ncbi:hypothetical protein ACJX0J_019465, partial [Zea mays]
MIQSDYKLDKQFIANRKGKSKSTRTLALDCLGLSHRGVEIATRMQDIRVKITNHMAYRTTLTSFGQTYLLNLDDDNSSNNLYMPHSHIAHISNISYNLLQLTNGIDSSVKNISSIYSFLLEKETKLQIARTEDAAEGTQELLVYNMDLIGVSHVTNCFFRTDIIYIDFNCHAFNGWCLQFVLKENSEKNIIIDYQWMYNIYCRAFQYGRLEDAIVGFIIIDVCILNLLNGLGGGGGGGNLISSILSKFD